MACVSFWHCITEAIQMASGGSWLTRDSIVKDEEEEEVVVPSMYSHNQAILKGRIWFDLKFDLPQEWKKKLKLEWN